ncbi:alcohol dehydrogenase catalytic domain-containing protein [Streptomyces sp. NPDC091281]|uniref:alcohol dehydrogenase catalytic domain-containing protein n=1 Tax=Streptomyces sp. NPDC091281 TaxID=3365985 RepID=UPI0037FCE139
MRGIVRTGPGDPADVLTFSDRLTPPRPGPGQVAVSMCATAIHAGDLLGVREGWAAPDPARPAGVGSAGSGTVQSVGQGVTGVAPGDRVAFFGAAGAWQEVVLAPAAHVHRVPDALPDDVAALALVNPLTMRMLMRAVDHHGGGAAGADGPILHAAAGSAVGTLVSAAADRHDLSLIALVRSADTAARHRARWPKVPVITTSADGWEKRLDEAIGGRPVRVALDPVGGPVSRAMLDRLGEGGTLLSYGRLDSRPSGFEPFDLVRRQRAAVGVSIEQWAGLDDATRADDVAFALDLVAARPDLAEIAGHYDLAEHAVAVAHARRPDRTGTVLLTRRP